MALSIDTSRLVLSESSALSPALKAVSERFEALNDLELGLGKFWRGEHDGEMVEKLSKGVSKLATHEWAAVVEKAEKKALNIDELQSKLDRMRAHVKREEHQLRNEKSYKSQRPARRSIAKQHTKIEKFEGRLADRLQKVESAAAKARIAALAIDPSLAATIAEFVKQRR